MTRLVSLLKPDRWKVLLFVALFGLVAGGMVQSWAFADDVAAKPPLYDLLRPLPLWPVAVLLLAPLLLVSAPLLSLGVDLSALDSWYSVAAVGCYLYVIACAGVALAQRRRATGTDSGRVPAG